MKKIKKQFMKYRRSNKNILVSIFFLIITALAVAVWYAPIIFKGYHATTLGSNALVRSRNLAGTGIYSAESEKNIILSSELIAAKGQESVQGSKLRSVIYAKILKVLNLNSANQIVLVNSIILALALLFFSLVVYCLFGFKITLFFSLIYIFLPSNWFLPQSLQGYEIALVFLSLFFLFFLSGTNRFKIEARGNAKLQVTCLLAAGILLSLACLSLEALLLILPILFIFLVVIMFKQSKRLEGKLFKRLLTLKKEKLKSVWISRGVYLIFAPVIIILSIFWLPDFFSQQNIYSLNTGAHQSEEFNFLDYSYYAEFYPDPYTYHFERQEYLDQQINQAKKKDLMRWMNIKKQSSSVGDGDLDFQDRLKIGLPLMLRHLFRFLSIPEIGGPFIFFLLSVGLLVLKQKKSYLFSFYLWWILGSIFLMSFIAMVGRNHLMDFGWAIALCASLGVVCLANLISDKFWHQKNVSKSLVGGVILLLLVYNLVLSGHVMWSQKYNNSPVPLILAYAEEVEKINPDSTQVIAAPLAPNEAYNINFNTNKSIVVIKTKTIEKLIKQDKLAEIFEEFGVKYILGYTPELTKEIIENSQVANITDSSIQIKQEDIRMNNKNWFLNLVK